MKTPKPIKLVLSKNGLNPKSNTTHRIALFKPFFFNRESDVVGYKSCGGQKVAIFRQTSENFRREITGAQRFNFAPKFTQSGAFSDPFFTLDDDDADECC